MNSLKEAKDTGEIQWVIDLGRYKRLTEEAKAGYDVEGRFLHPIDRALTLLLLDRENFWIHDSIGVARRRAHRPPRRPPRHVTAGATKKFSCLGTGGLSGSGDCGSTCGPVGCGSCFCDLRHCSSHRDGCCRGCGSDPAPDGTEIRAAIPPSKPHTKF